MYKYPIVIITLLYNQTKQNKTNKKKRIKFSYNIYSTKVQNNENILYYHDDQS